ncbi:hypothetical protein AB4564_07350 [Vibrio sp. 10N.222.51.E8]|uniref:hypothetical protein n=1 Tax=unclassified Vibrio TaxID=2614977 RepID=UPI001F0D68F7|nr:MULTISPECIES: hypothetical protein [unclassified Vibrio]
MKKLITLTMCTLLSACAATVPKEVVELSYQMEKDMSQVEEAYVTLVRQHVSMLKKQREDYLYREWVPVMLEDWIQTGQLIEMAQGTVVYDESMGGFKTVTQPDRLSQLSSITEWALAASEEIEAKKRELIQPLEEAEQKLIADIHLSFNLLIQGNQTITAHLNSIREVQDVQNKLLERAGWDGLRDNINQQLSELSEQAVTGLDEVRKLDSKTQKQLEKLQ